MFGFPLLLIPLAICNIILLLMRDVSLSAPLSTLTLMSRAAWTVTLSDALLAFGILLLLFEVIKGARPGGKYFTDHFLALLVFAGAAAEFVLLPQFGNSTFFLLALLALVDFLSGVALRARRPRKLAAATTPVRETSAQEIPLREAPVQQPVAPPAPAAVNREPTFETPPIVIVPETATPMPAPVTTPVRAEPPPSASDLNARVEPIIPREDSAAEKRDVADSPKIVSPGLAPNHAPNLPPDAPSR